MPTDPHSNRGNVDTSTFWQIWTDIANLRGSTLEELMPAVAYLGGHAILDEWDATEVAEAEFEGRSTGEKMESGWITSCNSRPGHEWPNGWLHTLRPNSAFRSYSQRVAMEHWSERRDRVFSVLDRQALVAAADILRNHPNEAPQLPFAAWFLPRWQSLLEALDHQRSRKGRPRLVPALRDFLTDLAKPEREERALIISDHLAHLVDTAAQNWLLYSGKPSQEPAVSRYGIDVLCSDLAEELAARVSQLARGVEPQAVETIAWNRIETRTQPRVENGLEIGWPESPWQTIIAAPPLGMRVRSETYPLPVHCERLEHHLLQWAVLSLAQNGRAFLLMPRNFSFASGEAKRVREWLLENYRLDAVIQLPPNLGWAGVHVPMTLLCVTKAPPRSHTLFLDEGLMQRRLMRGDDDEPSYLYNRGEVLSAVLQLMKPDIGYDDDERHLQTFSTDAEMAETWQLREMVGRALDSKGFDSGDGVLPLSGLVAHADFRKQDCELTFDRYIRDQQNPLLMALDALTKQNSNLRVVDLGSVTQIIPGIHYTKDKTIPSGKLYGAERRQCLGLVRVSDLTKPKLGGAGLPMVRAPELLLTPEASASVRPERRLQNWDILVSRSGTIGKLSVYYADDADVAPCAASGQIFVIRRRENHDPQGGLNLLSILSSAAGQEWLQGRAYGSTIQHLRESDLAEMPVIAGPESLMRAIGEHLLAGHPLETAVSVLENAGLEDATVTIFFESPLLRSLVAHPRGSAEPGTVIFQWQELRQWLGQWCARYQGAPPKGRLHAWWSAAIALLDQLIIAIGTENERDRLTLLLYLKLQLSERREALAAMLQPSRLGSGMPGDAKPDEVQRDAVQNYGRRLIDMLEASANSEAGELASSVKLIGTLSPRSITVATPTVVTISITSLSKLSLRDLQVRVAEQRAQRAHLEPHDTFDLPLTCNLPHTGTHPLLIEWSARRLDGTSVSGKIEGRVEVVSLRATAKTGLGINPYVDARTLQGDADAMFYGRQNELQRIAAELKKATASTVLLVEGNRRTGKTSLLHHFNKHYLPNDWVAAYCTFQSAEGAQDNDGISGRGVPTHEVFYVLAKAVVEAVVAAGVKLQLEGIGEFDPGLRPIVLHRRTTSLLRPYFESGPPYEHFRIVLEQCLEAMQPRRLLLEIDEFDRLQEGIDSGVTSDQVPENIRHLFQTYNQMAGILTGSRKIRRLREAYWNVLFGVGDPIILRALDPDSVRKLVTTPVKDRLTYTPEAVELIANVTAGQPRIIQTLCSRLFDLCVLRPDSPLITMPMVEEVAAEKARDYEHFKVLWSAIQSAGHQLVALTINRMEREGTGRITFSLLHDDLIAQGLTLSPKDLEDALANLTDLEVVGEGISDSTKRYFIEIPLLSRWLNQNQDIDRLRDAALNELH